VSRPASHYHATITDRWGLPVSSLCPQISPPLLARVATTAKLLVMGWPPITTPRHKDGRLSTCHLVPSRRLRCAVTSHHRCPPASALVGTVPVRFWSRPLSDEVFEQAALLAKLPLQNACHICHCLALPTHACSRVGRVRCRPSLHRVDTWMPPCPAHYPDANVRTNAARVPFTRPPFATAPLCHTSTLALPPR
jgi:hypothetical protein